MTRTTDPRRHAWTHTRRTLALVVAAIWLAACGTTTPTLGPSAKPTASSAPSATPGPEASSGIVVDQTLVDHLPLEVSGIELVSDPDTAGDIATDPGLAANASAIAVAFAIAPDASTGDDVAVVSVVRLRPGVFGDAFFRSWRDSYDAAACDAAGGLTGNAQAEVDGRDVSIGTCAGGAHTYHVYLEAADVVVSVTSVGDRRLGEQIVAGLRE